MQSEPSGPTRLMHRRPLGRCAHFTLIRLRPVAPAYRKVGVVMVRAANGTCEVRTYFDPPHSVYNRILIERHSRDFRCLSIRFA